MLLVGSAVLEGVASFIFTIEYVFRIATADFLYPKSGAIMSRIRFVMSVMVIVDLVSAVPEREGTCTETGGYLY